jgi:hypothetical protein
MDNHEYNMRHFACIGSVIRSHNEKVAAIITVKANGTLGQIIGTSDFIVDYSNTRKVDDLATQELMYDIVSKGLKDLEGTIGKLKKQRSN